MSTFKVLLFSCFISFILQSMPGMAQEKVVVIPLIGGGAESLQNIVTVSSENGDFADPVAANNSITDAGFSNKYLIVIGPGTYTLTERLDMQPYVSITGSGRELTQLQGAFASGKADQDASVVQMAEDARLSSLSVYNLSGGGNWRIGIYAENIFSSGEIVDVLAESIGGTARAGIYNIGGKPTMIDVIGKGTYSGGPNHYGIVNDGASPIMTDVTGEARNSTGLNAGIWNTTGASPTMNGVTAIAFGGTETYGMFNNESSNPVMMNVIADSSNGTGLTYGVYNRKAAPMMMNVIATGNANGAGDAGGVYNVFGATPTMINVEASGTNGVNNYGVYSKTNSPSIIRRSTLEGSPALYMSNAGSATKISQSSVIGGVNAAYASCVASDDGTGGLLSSTCQ